MGKSFALILLLFPLWALAFEVTEIAFAPALPSAGFPIDVRFTACSGSSPLIRVDSQFGLNRAVLTVQGGDFSVPTCDEFTVRLPAGEEGFYSLVVLNHYGLVGYSGGFEVFPYVPAPLPVASIPAVSPGSLFCLVVLVCCVVHRAIRSDLRVSSKLQNHVS